MKCNLCLTFLLSLLLSFALSAGAVGSMVTGYDLTMLHMDTVLYLCFGISLTVSFFLLFKRGILAVLGLLVLTGGFLLYRGIPTEPFLSLISTISRTLHNAYGWNYLHLAPSGVAADWPMATLGGLVALTAAGTFTRGKGTVLTAVLAAAPIAACMLVTNTVPEETYLFLLMTGLILLFLTAGVRKTDLHQGSRLTAIAAVPVILTLGLLFRFVPQEGYVNRSRELQEKLISYVQHLPELVETTVAEVATNMQGSAPEDVDLSRLGARPRYTHTVMDITADTGGTVYLRGQDYDVYSGTGWTASPHRAEPFFCDGNLAGNITVRTRSKKDSLYLPYYPGGGQTLVGGKAANREGDWEYTLPRITLPEDWKQKLAEQEQAGSAVLEWTDGALPASDLELLASDSPADRMRYLTLPPDTQAQAQALLPGILPETADSVEKAEAIAAYVRNSARYDLNTGRMPRSEEDFALWFLRESDTGYCVHFATAAVVLLRAADIPARYVTGYMVQAAAGQVTKVTGGNAHAWAEYYVPQLGTWVVLEATPADESAPASTAAPTESSAPTEETELTAPPESAEVTRPTLPPVTEPAAPEREKAGFYGAVLLWSFLAAALILLQRHLRLTIRRRHLRSGEPNAQALARWQEARHLARLAGEEVPEALFSLAQKAKFSQHTLTSEELLTFDGYLNACRRRLKKRPWYRQLLYRFFWAVY